MDTGGCVVVVLAVIWASVHCARKPQTPPVWEFTYQYELFEKIYEQTQQIQRQLHQKAGCAERVKSCPDHWVHADDRCYFLPPHWKLNWHDGQTTCERLGGNLAILDTESKHSVVSDYIRGIQMSDVYNDVTYVWIGGFDFNKEGDWMWVSGRIMNTSDWRIGSEDDVTGMRSEREDCLVWGDGRADNNCAIHFHFVCEKVVQ